MADDIRVTKNPDGSTSMVNVTAINDMIDSIVKESVIERLRRSCEAVKTEKSKAVAAQKNKPEFAL